MILKILNKLLQTLVYGVLDNNFSKMCAYVKKKKQYWGTYIEIRYFNLSACKVQYQTAYNYHSEKYALSSILITPTNLATNNATPDNSVI